MFVRTVLEMNFATQLWRISSLRSRFMKKKQTCADMKKWKYELSIMHTYSHVL